MKRRTLPAVLLLLAVHVGYLAWAQFNAPDRTAARTVFLVGNLPDAELVAFTANLAASGHPGVLLLDSARSAPYLKAFLSASGTERVIPVGGFDVGPADLQERFGKKTSAAWSWKRGPPDVMWDSLFPKAGRVVVCPAEPRGLLLQAASLAGAYRAPLLLWDGTPEREAALRERVAAWKPRVVFGVGTAARFGRDLSGVDLVTLPDEEAVARAYVRFQGKQGPLQTLVVANPAEAEDGRSLSALAPWVALQRRAALLLTDAKGDNTTALVRGALKTGELARADHLILVGDLAALPMERRANPLPGADESIPLEPPAPEGTGLFTFATGRLFHEDRAVVALMLARQRLLEREQGERRAFIVSNPGGGLPLLEAISRNTARELANAGYQTTALFNEAASRDKLRRALPRQDIFLWEGHHSTLVADYNVPGWPEPTAPSLVFLQSCLALNEREAHPFLQRGAVAVVGAPTRTYSASGGAFTLAFFDALLYDQQSLGGALRHAKNFLLAFADLKAERLGKESKLGGANVRSAWSFTLWGDPTVKLPRPKPPVDALPTVRARVKDDRITLTLPEKQYEKAASVKYDAQIWPNGRLGGLTRKTEDGDRKQLVPLLFAEVSLPQAAAGKKPRLQGKVPDDRWTFRWDERRQTGYLLVLPRSQDRKKVEFQLAWDDGP